MSIERHQTSTWIKNDLIDVSSKVIEGSVSVHWHEFYEIELILDGSGVYNIDGVDYDIKKGIMFIMSPISFHYINFTEKTKLINIMFTLNLCELDFLSNIFDAKPHIMLNLKPEDIDFYCILSKEMIHYERADDIAYKYMSSLLNSILGKICSLKREIGNTFEASPIQYAILYIQNNFKENISLKDAAKIANYSPNYFNNQFKAYTGMTFKQYLINLRLAFAKNLLYYIDLSITQICYECGFNDFSNFMSIFKKEYGVTPKKMRML